MRGWRRLPHYELKEVSSSVRRNSKLTTKFGTDVACSQFETHLVVNKVIQTETLPRFWENILVRISYIFLHNAVFLETFHSIFSEYRVNHC